MNILNCLLVLTFLSVNFHIDAQDRKHMHLQKDDFIKKHLYENWKIEIAKTNKKIADPEEPWIYKSSLHRENKLFLMINILPKDKSIITDVFDEAVGYEPNGFCESYLDRVDRDREFLPIIKSYLVDELYYMDSVCLAQLVYDNALIKEIMELQTLISDYRGSEFHEGNKSSIAKQKSTDQQAWILAQKILNKVGIPGRDLVGLEYENVMWQTIYHKGKDVVEAYLPKIKAMVDDRKLNPQAYPKLYDRLCYLKGIPQYYGTYQVWNEETQKLEQYITKEKETLEKRRSKYALW